MKHWINALCLVSAIFCSAQSLADNVFYRYRDEDGTMTMATMLPPDRADAGYDVINKSGEIVQTVPPKNVKANSEKANESKAETKEDEQKRQEDLLLKSFGSQREIERARDDKLASIKVFASIVEENLHSLNKQLQDIKESIAARKENNEAIPPNFQKNLDETIRQIKEGEDFLSKKAIEKKQVEEKYDALIKKFNDLHKQNSQSTETAPSPDATPTSPPSAS